VCTLAVAFILVASSEAASELRKLLQDGLGSPVLHRSCSTSLVSKGSETMVRGERRERAVLGGLRVSSLHKQWAFQPK
jgi:acyl CoA:acetate/3-ketoacid CoA transferase beta subunit